MMMTDKTKTTVWGWLGGGGTVALVALVSMYLLKPSCDVFALDAEVASAVHDHDRDPASHPDVRVELAKKLTALETQQQGLTSAIEKLELTLKARTVYVEAAGPAPVAPPRGGGRAHR